MYTTKLDWIPTDILSIPTIDIEELEAMIGSYVVSAPRVSGSRRKLGGRHAVASHR